MSRKQRPFWINLLIVLVAACGGGGGGGGGTSVLTGRLILPPPNQCANCTTNGNGITVLALNKDAGPQAVTTATADSQGAFNIPNPALAGKTVIVVASMSQAASMGGVEAVGSGNNAKDFDVHTQIACQASVFLTAGTSGSGCTVAANCSTSGDPNCFPTEDPSFLNNSRIANLEKAAAFIQARVSLDDGGAVKRAACATINCTLASVADPSAECMNANFP